MNWTNNDGAEKNDEWNDDDFTRLSVATVDELGMFDKIIGWLQSGVQIPRPSPSLHRKAKSHARAWKLRDKRAFLKCVLPAIQKDVATAAQSRAKGNSRGSFRKNTGGGRGQAPHPKRGRATNSHKASTVGPASVCAEYGDAGCRGVERMEPRCSTIYGGSGKSCAALANLKTERRMQRRVIYKRRVAFSSGTTPRTSSKQVKLPMLNMNVSVGGWNKRFSVVRLDLVGAMDCAEGFRNVCLLTSIRAHGIEVPITRDGPFRALTDGNAFLSPVGYKLTHTPFASLTTGQYVKWHKGHFTAVNVGQQVQVIDGSSTAFYHSVGDVGRADEHYWYRLSKSNEDPVAANGDPVRLDTTADFVFGRRAAALFRKQELAAKRRCVNAACSTHSPEQLEQVRQNREDALARRVSQLVRPIPPPEWPRVCIPDAPTTFAEDLHLPNVPFLRFLNPHSRDCRLYFFEDTHTYLIDGVRSTERMWCKYCVQCSVFSGYDALRCTTSSTHVMYCRFVHYRPVFRGYVSASMSHNKKA